MKKMLLLLLLVVVFTNSNAQTKAGIYGTSIITWIGLDFTHLKFIDDTDLPTDSKGMPKDLKTTFFPAWNKLIVDERIKYDVAGAVQRDNIAYNIDCTLKANDHAPDDFYTHKLTDYQLLTEDAISSLVSKYDFHGKTGIGLMFFVEGMCKEKLEASMWVTFVDMGTHKVLQTRRMTGHVGGFGFRNYWAKCFYNVISDLGSDLKKEE